MSGSRQGRPIRFLLDGVVRELADIDPTTTVLNWLRYEARRTGTKEGCAEGDCGACTVVLGELDASDPKGVRFRAVNACILFVPMLDGRALFTVESLKRNGEPHPVQQAMVERHATQCGFCTPGFVMSLYAHQRQGAATDSQTLKDALAGNLCRCTGYGPILAAGQSMGPDPHASEVGALALALKGLRRDEPLALMHRGRSFIAPRTTAQLAEALLARPDATILAGGTDVGLWVTKQHRDLPALISLNEVAELSAIKDLGDAVWIGAGVRYVDAQPALVELHAEFGELMRRIGGLPVRNLGTVCGNIANGSPIGDMPPALIAAGATLVLRHGETKRTIPLETYFLTYGQQDRRPGEFVEAVIVPKIATNRILKIFKLSKRLDQDISAVCAGISATVEGGVVAGARIAFGGMAAIPRRATALERALEGRAWTEAGVAGALDALEQDFQPIDDMRASAGYRLQAAKNLILRAVLESEPGAPRVMGLEPVHD